MDFSDLIDKTFLFLFDEYEYLFKYGFDQPTGFTTLRNFSSKLSDVISVSALKSPSRYKTSQFLKIGSSSNFSYGKLKDKFIFLIKSRFSVFWEFFNKIL